MNFDELLNKFTNQKRLSNGSYQCSCPLPSHKHGDKSQSLTITEKEDRILLFCHVCGESATPEILKSVELEEKDLFKKNWNRETSSSNSPSGGDKKTCSLDWIIKNSTSHYFYNNDKNEYEILKVRYLDKNTGEEVKGCFYHYAGCDRWIKNLNGKRPQLYKLPELLQAIKTGEEYIFDVEGEKDVDTLSKLGLTAVTSGSAKSWQEKFKDYYKGTKKVIILPDNDQPGKEYALEKAKSLHGIAEEVKIVELPGLKEREDVTDWINSGHTKEELLELAKNTPVYSPPTTAPTEQKEEKKKKTLLDYDLQPGDLNIPEEWLIKDILAPYTINLYYSASGAGKSFYWLLKSIYLLKEKKVDTIIYLDNDNSKRALKSRYIAEIKAHYSNFIYIPSFKVDNELLATLEEELKTKKYGHSLIIVDSIRNFMLGKNPNEDKDSISFMDKMKYFRSLDNTVIMLHHVNKMKQIKNNTSFVDYSDVVYQMTASNDKEKKRIFLEFSCEAEKGKDRIGSKETFTALLDYDILQLIVQEAGVNPEDFDFVSYVRDLLTEYGYLNQRTICEYAKYDLSMRTEDAFILLKKYTGILWNFERGTKNACIYSLKEEINNNNILYICLKDIKNSGKLENSIKSTDSPETPSGKLENLDTANVSDDLTCGKLENSVKSIVSDNTGVNIDFNEVNSILKQNFGLNTQFSSLPEVNRKETGRTIEFSSFPAFLRGDKQRIGNQEITPLLLEQVIQLVLGYIEMNFCRDNNNSLFNEQTFRELSSSSNCEVVSCIDCKYFSGKAGAVCSVTGKKHLAHQEHLCQKFSSAIRDMQNYYSEEEEEIIDAPF